MSDSVSVRAVILCGVSIRRLLFASLRAKYRSRETNSKQNVQRWNLTFVFSHFHKICGEKFSLWLSFVCVCVHIFLTHKLTRRMTEVGWMDGKKHATTWHWRENFFNFSPLSLTHSLSSPHNGIIIILSCQQHLNMLNITTTTMDFLCVWTFHHHQERVCVWVKWWIASPFAADNNFHLLPLQQLELLPFLHIVAFLCTIFLEMWAILWKILKFLIIFTTFLVERENSNKNCPYVARKVGWFRMMLNCYHLLLFSTENPHIYWNVLKNHNYATFQASTQHNLIPLSHSVSSVGLLPLDVRRGNSFHKKKEK